MSEGRCEVLLVEDNPADARLVRECLSSSSVPFRLHVVRDGDAALAFLERSASKGGGEPSDGLATAEAPPPDLVLLDLNLPGRDGREILAEIRAREAWQDLLVIVLTSSQSSADVEVCTRLRADAYVTKPVDLAGFDGVVSAIENIWRSRRGSAPGG